VVILIVDMIELLFFPIFSWSVPTADLTPPFYLNHKHRIGYWEIKPSSIVFEDSIMLIPPIQSRIGGIWNTLPLPEGFWSVNISIQIQEGTGGGGFSFWLIEEFGVSGSFYGGPTKFKGLSIIGSVFVNDSHFPILNIFLIESNGSSEFCTFSEDSKIEGKYDLTDEPFTIELQIDRHEITFCIENMIIKKPFTIDISKNWFGLTASNDDFTSRIDILSIKYIEWEYFSDRTEISIEKSKLSFSDSNFGKKKETIFRNPSFVKMKSAILKFRENEKSNSKTVDVNEVLSIIVEIGDALIESATFNILSNFIGKRLSELTNDWYRRTFKMIEMSESTRTRHSIAINSTIEMIENLNRTIRSNWGNAEIKVSELNFVVKSSIDSGIDIIENNSDDFWFLRYFVIVEVIFVIFLYFSQFIPSIRYYFELIF
jgi:hypothetical protein